MAYEIYTPIALNQNEILEVALENLAVAPASPVVGQIYFDTALGVTRVWDGTAWDAAGPAAKFATDIGDGVALSYVVTHNLNTRDFVASLFDNTLFTEVLAAVTHTTVNTATFTFTVIPTLNQYRVTILA